MSITESASLHSSNPAPGSSGESRNESDEVKIVGSSNAMERLRLQIQRIGPHFRTVLIRGEAGTGKWLVARALHALSRDAADPIVRCHPRTVEDDLTNYEGQGTLFLDAIDEMPLDAQGKVLQALDEHEPAQIIASTNEDTRTFASTGRFRLELYQRLATVEITLPPLRERMADIPELSRYFLARPASLHRDNPQRISDEAIAQMQQYRWPGNVQELKEVLRNCVLRTRSQVLEVYHLPAFAALGESTDEARSVRLHDVVEQHVLQVLRDCGGNKLRAAERLGISRSTLYRMLGAGVYTHRLH